MNCSANKTPYAYNYRTIYTYDSPEILFKPANLNESFEKENNNRSEFSEKNLNDLNNGENFALGDIVSIDNDRLSVLGISINIDDLVIIAVLFFMIQSGTIDYTLAIVLGLLLFSQE